MLFKTLTQVTGSDKKLCSTSENNACLFGMRSFYNKLYFFYLVQINIDGGIASTIKSAHNNVNVTTYPTFTSP